MIGGLFEALSSGRVCDKGNINFLHCVVYTEIDFVLPAKAAFKHKDTYELSTKVRCCARPLCRVYLMRAEDDHPQPSV